MNYSRKLKQLSKLASTNSLIFTQKNNISVFNTGRSVLICKQNLQKLKVKKLNLQKL